MNQVVIKSVLKFLLRRGLSLLGAGGMAVSDEWIATTAGLILIGVNELVQWVQAHKAEKAKRETVTVR